MISSSNIVTRIHQLTAERGILVRSNSTVLDVVTEEIITNALAAVRTSLKPYRTLPRCCTERHALINSSQPDPTHQMSYKPHPTYPQL